MKSVIKTLLVWLAAVVTTYVLASVFATQSVMARLAEMGISVSITERFSTTLQDVVGMSGMFLPLIAFGLLIAFVVAAILTHWLKPWRNRLFILAGAAGVLTLHVVLEAMLGITPVAAARTMGGLLMQGIAGAVGGWVFIRLNRVESAPRTAE